MHNWPRISRGGKARKYWNNHSPLLCCCRSLLFCLTLLVPADAILSLLLLSWWTTWCYGLWRRKCVNNAGSFSLQLARPCTTVSSTKHKSWPDMVRARALNSCLLHSKRGRNALTSLTQASLHTFDIFSLFSAAALQLWCELQIDVQGSILMISVKKEGLYIIFPRLTIEENLPFSDAKSRKVEGGFAPGRGEEKENGFCIQN